LASITLLTSLPHRACQTPTEAAVARDLSRDRDPACINQPHSG
jgi:hypothetical protein